MNKKMETVFEGYVNGKKFDDRKAMNQFIGECISNGVEITNMSYSQTTRPACELTSAEVANCGCPSKGCVKKEETKIDWDDYMDDLMDLVPRPYTSVLGYIIPFVDENLSFSNDEFVKKNQADLETKLTRRMEWAEKYVLSEIRTGKYDVNELKAWITSAINNLNRKAEWANNRIEQINDVVEIARDCRVDSKDTFILDRVDTRGLEAYKDIYAQVAGYCSAMVDILARLKMGLKA